MSFGRVIRQLRERRGWAQEELAHRIGTSAANLSRIETGKHGASETLKKLLAREFEMRVSELVALSEGVTAARPARLSDKDDKEERKLLGFYRALPSDRRTLLVSIAKLLDRA